MCMCMCIGVLVGTVNPVQYFCQAKNKNPLSGPEQWPQHSTGDTKKQAVLRLNYSRDLTMKL